MLRLSRDAFQLPRTESKRLIEMLSEEEKRAIDSIAHKDEDGFGLHGFPALLVLASSCIRRNEHGGFESFCWSLKVSAIEFNAFGPQERNETLRKIIVFRYQKEAAPFPHSSNHVITNSNWFSGQIRLYQRSLRRD